VVKKLKNCWYGIPLLTLPIYNLLQTISIGRLEWSVSFVLWMAFVAVCEELFFRGFLVQRFSIWGIVTQVIGSSALFALAHVINLFGNADVLYVLLQITCAFVIGICFALITIQSGTLFLSIIVHFLTNVSAPVTFEPNVSELAVCIVIYSFYAALVWRKIQKNSDYML
jgi:membrane protease YdiL (CAAX protease family)